MRLLTLQDLNALQRLVKASVAALKNAAAADGNASAGAAGRGAAGGGGSSSTVTATDAMNFGIDSGSAAASSTATTDVMPQRPASVGWGAKDSYYIAGDVSRSR